MAFIYFCGIIALVLQGFILSCTTDRFRSLRILSLPAMELLPLCLGAHAFLTQKPGGVLGWRFHIAVSGWMAAALLAGWALAWMIWLFKRK